MQTESQRSTVSPGFAVSRCPTTPLFLLLLSFLLLLASTRISAKVGIDTVTEYGPLVDCLTLNLDSEDVLICTQVLELLAVITVSSEEGFRVVLCSCDYFKAVKRERVRFFSLVNALVANETSVVFKVRRGN